MWKNPEVAAKFMFFQWTLTKNCGSARTLLFRQKRGLQVPLPYLPSLCRSLPRALQVFLHPLPTNGQQQIHLPPRSAQLWVVKKGESVLPICSFPGNEPNLLESWRSLVLSLWIPRWLVTYLKSSFWNITSLVLICRPGLQMTRTFAICLKMFLSFKNSTCIFSSGPIESPSIIAEISSSGFDTWH